MDTAIVVYSGPNPVIKNMCVQFGGTVAALLDAEATLFLGREQITVPLADVVVKSKARSDASTICILEREYREFVRVYDFPPRHIVQYAEYRTWDWLNKHCRADGYDLHQLRLVWKWCKRVFKTEGATRPLLEKMWKEIKSENRW